jgi:hypothetical protein
MSRCDFLALGGFGTAALLLLAHGWTRSAPPAGPRSLEEVARLAADMGLHYRSDRLNGELACRLVVSNWPITHERANSVRFGEADHPCWQGTVAVSTPWHCFGRYGDPDHGVVWGEVFLFGDPALIRALVEGYPARPVRPPS